MQKWLLLLAKYRQRRYSNPRQSTSWVLAVYRIKILSSNRHGSLIDSWHSTGLLLSLYWLLLLAKYRQRSYANLQNSTGLVLAVNRIQILMAVGAQLAYSWCSTNYLYWRNTDNGGMLTLGTVLVECWLYTTSKYGISTDMEVSSTVSIPHSKKMSIDSEIMFLSGFSQFHIAYRLYHTICFLLFLKLYFLCTTKDFISCPNEIIFK